MKETSFFLIFFVKKSAEGEISDRFSGKTQYNRASIFTKQKWFFMLGRACCFNQFLVKKRTNREISGRFSGKDPYNITTIFPKRNGFFMIDT